MFCEFSANSSIWSNLLLTWIKNRDEQITSSWKRRINLNPNSFTLSENMLNCPFITGVRLCAHLIYAFFHLCTVATNYWFLRWCVVPDQIVAITCSWSCLYGVDEVRHHFRGIQISYRQIDGITMGSLGPTMASIYLPYFEQDRYYVRYEYYTFCVFENEIEIVVFYVAFKTFHPALHFTWVFFLFLMSKMSSTRFFTSVYRKPTFMVWYTQWVPFCSKQLKIIFVKTLVYWSLIICM